MDMPSMRSHTHTCRSKSVSEYPLPAASMTHELAQISGQNLLVISQMDNSTLLKLVVDPATGKPQAVAAFPLGSMMGGLHGLVASKEYPGQIWCTFQFDNKLVRVDPANGLETPPVIKQEIPIPAPGRGPHGIIEEGPNVWTTLKDSAHVLRINHTNPADYTLCPAERKPIFVARHPTSGEFYASQDQASQILRMDEHGNYASTTPIPAAEGATPVGLIAGPDGNIWFTLLNAPGTFGRIGPQGEYTWFHLTTPLGKTAALLHLNFDPNPPGPLPRLFLLGSSITNPGALNAVFAVTLSNDYTHIDTQQTFVMPTQGSKVHRVLPAFGGLYVTELTVSLLAHIPLQTTASEAGVDEAGDYYSMMGLGVDAQRIRYN
jgi:virginiamycin B lyase